MDLGLPEETFWRLFPIEFQAMYDRFTFNEERKDFRAASICTIIANANRGKDQKPFKLEDFMVVKPKYRGDTKKSVKEKKQTPGAMLALVEMWNAGFGGEDQRPK